MTKFLNSMISATTSTAKLLYKPCPAADGQGSFIGTGMLGGPMATAEAPSLIRGLTGWSPQSSMPHWMVSQLVSYNYFTLTDSAARHPGCGREAASSSSGGGRGSLGTGLVVGGGGGQGQAKDRGDSDQAGHVSQAVPKCCLLGLDARN